MPSLHWIGKEKIINHHHDVPFRVLNKKYTYPETSDSSDNLIINGDNLEALKSLLPKYEGKIKVIYLDPPYNTGKEGWVFNDNVNHPSINKWLGKVVGSIYEDFSRHDKWLCMMYPRLKLIQKLLSEDGVIFISIDNNEFSNLAQIMDEIFGEDNFITNFAVENNPKGRKNNIFVADSYEYCLVYAKNKRMLYDLVFQTGQKKFFNNIIDDDTKDTRKIHEDEEGVFRQSKRQVVGTNKSNKRSLESKPERSFTIYYQKDSNSMILLDEYDLNKDEYILSEQGERLINNGYKRYVSLHKPTGKPSVPLYTKKTMIEKHKSNLLFFKDDGTIYEKDRSTSKQITSMLPNKRYGIDLMTESARALLEKIFSQPQVFENPKNVEFIKMLISLYPDKNIIVLDPFAGSGTTAHSVLKLNDEDGGNRKFILIEMMDYAEDVTAKRIKKVISGYNSTSGLDGNFNYYSLGNSLFTDDGYINKEIDISHIKKYIFYTETRKDLGLNHNSKYYLGTENLTDYYLFYNFEGETNLDYSSLSEIKTKNENYVIYADKCTIKQEDLEKMNIVFKKIPRDIIKL